MKTNRILLLAVCSLLFACNNDEEDILPQKSDTELKEDISELQVIGEAELITKATSVTETANGFSVDGSISADIENEGTMDIATGKFEYTVDDNGKIIKIVGDGLVDFPNLGVFAKIRETFNWEKLKSHVEYEKGSYFKDTYKTDIPLTDDRYYFHFKVLDDKGDGFSLKHRGNVVIYNFADFYLDINDPAVFFKMQVWKPGSGSGSQQTTSVAKKLFAKLKSMGSELSHFTSAPNVVIAISNQATITSSSYEFSKPEVFQELFGYSGFDKMQSHGYLKLKNVPIPGSVIFRFMGDMYVHGPVGKLAPSPEELILKRENAFVDWFNETETGQVTKTFNGSIDFGGKGIGFVLGLLPNINGVLGYDVFNKDFSLDMVGATYQEQDPGLLGGHGSFLRFGGEIRKPILAEILGEEISKFIPSQPVPTGFLYLNIEEELENWSLFIESSADLIVPAIGKTEVRDSHFLLNKDGINFEGNLTLPTYGILNFDRKFKGTIGRQGFSFESEHHKDITLPNGITLVSKDLKSKVSNTKGLYLEGHVKLPLGITDAKVLGIINGQEVTFEGTFSHALDLGYGFNLPSKEMTFMTSTNADKGISYSGSLDIPHIGYNNVTGFYNTKGFGFSGEVNRKIDFKGVEIPISNGNLELSSAGIRLDGKFTLPYGLHTSALTGAITKEEMKLTGVISNGITIGGHTFAFSNSYISASTLTGVKFGGVIDLKVFSTKVDGVINPGGTFRLTGTHTHTSKFLVANINVVVTQASATMTGTGTIYGALGNPLATGNITFKPNWAAGTVEACIGSFCVNL